MSNQGTSLDEQHTSPQVDSITAAPAPPQPAAKPPGQDAGKPGVPGVGAKAGPAPKVIGDATKRADTGDSDTLAKVHEESVAKIVFKRAQHAMAAGLSETLDAIDDPEVEDNELAGKLLEIAVDAAIAGSAEGLAVIAIESVAVHVAASVTEKEVEHSEAVQETLKATFESSAKAVIGTRDGRGVDTKELKRAFHRSCDIQQSNYLAALGLAWRSIATVIDSVPPVVARAVSDGLLALPAEKLIGAMNLSYMTAWMNFLARATHGASATKTGSPDKPSQDVDPDGIPMQKHDGSFQRPAKLFGVLQVDLSKRSDGYYGVYLDNVGKAARNALRRLGGPGGSPDLRL